MKKITKWKMEKIPAERKYFSDFNDKKEAFNQLVIHGWYGSNIDLQKYTFDLTNEEVDDLLEYIKGKLPKNKKIDDFREDVYLG